MNKLVLGLLCFVAGYGLRYFQEKKESVGETKESAPAQPEPEEIIIPVKGESTESVAPAPAVEEPVAPVLDAVEEHDDEEDEDHIQSDIHVRVRAEVDPYLGIYGNDAPVRGNDPHSARQKFRDAHRALSDDGRRIPFDPQWIDEQDRLRHLDRIDTRRHHKGYYAAEDDHANERAILHVTRKGVTGAREREEGIEWASTREDVRAGRNRMLDYGELDDFLTGRYLHRRFGHNRHL